MGGNPRAIAHGCDRATDAFRWCGGRYRLREVFVCPYGVKIARSDGRVFASRHSAVRRIPPGPIVLVNARAAARSSSNANNAIAPPRSINSRARSFQPPHSLLPRKASKWRPLYVVIAMFTRRVLFPRAIASRIGAAQTSRRNSSTRPRRRQPCGRKAAQYRPRMPAEIDGLTRSRRQSVSVAMCHLERKANRERQRSLALPRAGSCTLPFSEQLALAEWCAHWISVGDVWRCSRRRRNRDTGSRWRRSAAALSTGSANGGGRRERRAYPMDCAPTQTVPPR